MLTKLSCSGWVCEELLHRALQPSLPEVAHLPSHRITKDAFIANNLLGVGSPASLACLHESICEKTDGVYRNNNVSLVRIAAEEEGACSLLLPNTAI